MRGALNHIHIDAANMRVYEAMAAGACLLTHATTDLPAQGVEDKVHALLYRTMDEAVAQVKWALSDPVSRAAMGENARELVLDRHTYLHRAYRMLGIPVPANMRELVLTMIKPEEGTPMPVRGL